MQAPMATEDEIQREMDSIRSMKRISSQSGPGSLALDPDLPPQSLPGSSVSPGSTVRLSPTNHYANLPGIVGMNHPGEFEGTFTVARISILTCNHSHWGYRRTRSTPRGR